LQYKQPQLCNNTPKKLGVFTGSVQ